VVGAGSFPWSPGMVHPSLAVMIKFISAGRPFVDYGVSREKLIEADGLVLRCGAWGSKRKS